MNRWRGIVEFVSVVEAGSFSKAAENLGIVVSQVSKRVNDLEARLDTQLLHRSTRQLTTTPQGKLYYESCKRILAEFRKAEDDLGVQHQSLSGNLKLCCVGIAHPAFLIEVFAAFLKRYPKIELDFVFTDELPNLLEGGFDFALVAGDVDDSSYRSLRLSWADYHLVASPEFIRTHGEPAKPEELEYLPCITSSTENNWRLTNGEKFVSLIASGRFHSTHMPACIQAASCGLGVFMVPSHCLGVYTQGGKLVHILKDWYIRKPFMALAPQSSYLPAKLASLLEFLQEAMMIEPATDGKPGLSSLYDKGRNKMLAEIGETLKRGDVSSLVE